VLGATARKYAHKIPYLVKFNHNELMTYPNQFKQIPFGTIKQCWEMGAAAVGATIYFGSDDSTNQIQYVADMFAEAHDYGLVTVLWCYIRNNAFKVNGVDYHSSADLTSQANHLGVTIQADIIKQKLPTNNGGYTALNSGDSSYGKFNTGIYTDLCSSDKEGKGGHPIDLCRYQVANCYMGRSPLINSGGESKGASDLKDAVTTAVINKRAGGMGLISGRKAFQRPMGEGAALLQAIQDVYLDESVTIA
jgi:class I fructose-bisphosphate aldolase